MAIPEKSNSIATIKLMANDTVLACGGEWVINKIAPLEQQLKHFQWPKEKSIKLIASIKKMDSAGALLFNDLLKTLEKRQIKVTVTDLKKNQQELLDFITEHPIPEVPEALPEDSLMTTIGKKTITFKDNLPQIFAFWGEICVLLYDSIINPARVYLRYFLRNIETSGYNALPIIALLSFLIGVVIAYQMGLQLRNYGANVYIVDLVGISVFREFGPLITAIILAGRTGSAFTAELGTMKINEEIDALRTMSINPLELLVVPKLLGMLIAVPLLIVWADCFGIFGGMIMASNTLGIGFYAFLQRFPEVVTLKSFTIGIEKAPVFALIITLIGCYQGFQVTLSADSVGQQTTKSVVQAIFLIIVADSLFSIYYSWRGI